MSIEELMAKYANASEAPMDVDDTDEGIISLLNVVVK